VAHIDYYFTVLSPFTYLAGNRLEEIAAKHGATVAYKPVDIMKLFSEMGGTPPAQRHDSRKDYRLQDLKHLQKASGLPMNYQPAHWPTDQKPASAMIVAAAKAGQDVGALAFAVMRAVWAEEKDIADEDTLAAIAQGAGIDLEAVKPHLAEGAAAFDPMTAEAMKAGVFGSPFYITDGEKFWGQDRLDHLDAHLAG
jgi:2-hydroxychromene-2-carboxylate isomerase